MGDQPKKRGRGRGARAAAADASGEAGGGIRTVVVATKILKALAEYKNPVRVTDLARKLNMTMPTVSRHLSTWRELGFVAKPEGQETYRLGTELFSLGQAAAEQYTHISIAYPFLAKVRERVGETTIFATRLHDKAIAVACLDSGKPMTLTVRPGAILTLPYSPSARILWAFSEGVLERLDAHAKKLDFSEQRGLTEESFKRKVRFALKNWYDCEIDARHTGLGSIACPVFDHTNEVVAAAAVLMSAATMNDPPDQRLVQALQRCAASISGALGSNIWRQTKVAS